MYHASIEYMNGRLFKIKNDEKWYITSECIVFHYAQCSMLNIKYKNNCFLSLELKQASGENVVSKFQVVSKVWHKIP